MQTSLTNFGFLKVGCWRLDKKILNGINFKLNEMKQRHAIYAFVEEGNVKYIGCTAASNSSLNERMSSYRTKSTGSTNIRVRKELTKKFKMGRRVYIYAWIPPFQFAFRGLKCDFIVGFENALIARYNPEWNIAK